MNSSKRLVEGALFVAIYGVFMLASRFVGGILESTLFFILPFPLVLYTVRYGIKNALVPFISVAFVAFMINPINALFYVISANMLGVVYGELVKRQVKEVYLMVIAAATSLVLNLLSTYVFASLLGYNLQQDVTEMIAIVSSLAEQIPNLPSSEVIERMIYEILPASIMLFALMEGYLIHFSSSFILFRLKEIKRPATPYILWQWPSLFALGYLVLVLGFLALPMAEVPWQQFDWVRITLTNIVIVGSFLMIVQGISSFGLFCVRTNRRWLFSIGILAGFFFFLSFALVFLWFLGIYASLGDFRKKLLYNK